MTDLAYNENAVRTYERTAFVILERYNLGYNISYKTSHTSVTGAKNKADTIRFITIQSIIPPKIAIPAANHFLFLQIFIVT